VNKLELQKYDELPAKLVVTNPWEVLYVDLIGPYTLKVEDGTQIDFMCVIDPATSWFEIVKLPVSKPCLPIFPRVQRGVRMPTHLNTTDSSTLIKYQPQ
jgi:hypothetical protein